MIINTINLTDQIKMTVEIMMAGVMIKIEVIGIIIKKIKYQIIIPDGIQILSIINLMNQVKIHEIKIADKHGIISQMREIEIDINNHEIRMKENKIKIGVRKLIINLENIIRIKETRILVSKIIINKIQIFQEEIVKFLINNLMS